MPEGERRKYEDVYRVLVSILGHSCRHFFQTKIRNADATNLTFVQFNSEQEPLKSTSFKILQ